MEPQQILNSECQGRLEADLKRSLKGNLKEEKAEGTNALALACLMIYCMLEFCFCTNFLPPFHQAEAFLVSPVWIIFN